MRVLVVRGRRTKAQREAWRRAGWIEEHRVHLGRGVWLMQFRLAETNATW